MKHLSRSLFLVLIFLTFGVPVFAVPFSFEYNDTISFTDITGLSVGQAAKITVTLDNGGLSNVSQTWTAADLQSLSFDFNNGGLLTTFNDPFDGGLNLTTGNFMTDGTGALRSALTSWLDVSVTADFSTTGSGAQFIWFLNGVNAVYGQRPAVGSGSFFIVSLANVSGITSADNWSPASAAVPEPSTMLLFGTGLLGLMGYTWRRKQQEAPNT